MSRFMGMFYVCGAAFLFSFILNFFFCFSGKKLDVLKGRSAKGFYISKLGGMGIVFSFYLSLVAGIVYAGVFDKKIISVFWAAGFTFLLGLCDDFVDLKPFEKLFFQFLIAFFLVASGVKTEIVFLSKPLNDLCSIFWFLVLMNAFNLLDILDGLAAGLASICAATFLYVCFKSGNYAAGVLAAALLGSNLAFLRFNMPEAKLYMGDMGSQFNGVILGAVAIMISYTSLGKEVALAMPLLILALPLYDFLFVIIMRLLNRKSIMMKSRDHFVLRLIDRGASVSRVIFLMFFFNVLFSLSALLLLHASNVSGLIILGAAILGWVFLAYRISGKKRIA